MSSTTNKAASSSSSSTKYVLHGKTLSLLDFSQQFVKLLTFQGLLSTFLVLRFPTYPRLVEEFYENMKRKKIQGSYMVITKVRGKPVHLTSSEIAAWFDLPLNGVTCYDREGWANGGGASYRDYLGYLLGRDGDIAQDEKVNKYELSGEKRVLSLLISECLLPIKNKSCLLGKLECTFAYFIKNHILVNWPVQIINHMISTKVSKRVNLPYGMLISWILVNKHEIDVSEEPVNIPKFPNFDAKYLRTHHVYMTKANEYVSLAEIENMSDDEKNIWYEVLSIPKKRRKFNGGEQDIENGNTRPSVDAPRPEMDFSSLGSMGRCLDACEPSPLRDFMKGFLHVFASSMEKVLLRVNSLSQQMACIEHKQEVIERLQSEIHEYLRRQHSAT